MHVVPASFYASRKTDPDLWEHNLEDCILARAAAQGDQQAFNLLAERYRGYIYTIAYRVTLHEDDALDVTQNVLLRLVERIGDFRGESPFRGWLGAISANEAVSFARRRNRRDTLQVDFDPIDLEQLPADEPDARTVADRTERRQAVEAAMRQLSPQQRAVFALRFQGDLSPKEIAGQLNLPASQVRAQMVRAVCRIREVLFGTREKVETGKGE